MLRLTRLYPEQVARQWDIIGYAIEAALPQICKVVADRMNRIFMSILAGRLVVYIYHTEEAKIRAVMSASIVESVDAIEKQMLVYSFYGSGEITPAELVEGFELMKDLARGLGCTSIVAYTDVPKLKEFIAKTGGDTSLTFVRMEV